MTDENRARDNDLGVVDPLRLPGFVPAIARRLPPLAWVFVGLFVLDVVLRFRVWWPADQSLGANVVALVSFVAGPPITILLPAAILFRRRDAASSTPLALRGAAIVALAVLGSTLLRVVTAGWFVDDMFEPLTFEQVLFSAAPFFLALGTAAGWINIAFGLTRLRTGEPRLAVTRTATAVALALLAAAVAGSIAQAQEIPAAGTDFPILVPNAIVGTLVAVVSAYWAYVAWVLVRGIGDPLRPRRATLLAGATGIVIGFEALVSIAFAVLTRTRFDPASDDVFAYIAAGTIAVWLHRAAITALIVAFALGLADPVAMPEEPGDSPAPGGQALEAATGA